MKQPVAPTRDDAVVAPLSEVIGGPSGTRSAGHAWWTPVRVLLVLTAVAMALAMVKSTACANDSWADGEARYTHMCYSDLPYLYTGRGMAELHWPYIDEPEVRARYEAMEYPVGISYAAWVSAWMTHVWSGSPDLDRRAGLDPGALFGDPEVLPEINRFVVVNALWFTLLAMLSTWLLAGVHRRRPWDAAGFALAPALVLTVLINWDMWAVVCVAGVLWAWSRDRPWLTGLLVGVGTAVKLYPLFLLGGVLVICLRRRRWAAFGQAVAGAVLGWTALNLPAVLTGPDDWRVFWSFNSDRGADLGSVWLLLSQVFDVAFTAHTINLWSWVFFIAWCFGVLVLGWRAPLTPRLAQLGFLIVAGFLLVNKVYSPQYVLWLLPLAVLARPRWRDLLIWQAGEAVYFAAVWWYLGGLLAPAAGSDATAYWVAIILRLAAEGYLIGIVVRDVLRPDHDPVPDDRSDDLDPIEAGRGEPDPDVDPVTDERHPRPAG